MSKKRWDLFWGGKRMIISSQISYSGFFNKIFFCNGWIANETRWISKRRRRCWWWSVDAEEIDKKIITLVWFLIVFGVHLQNASILFFYSYNFFRSLFCYGSTPRINTNDDTTTMGIRWLYKYNDICVCTMMMMTMTVWWWQMMIINKTKQRKWKKKKKKKINEFFFSNVYELINDTNIYFNFLFSTFVDCVSVLLYTYILWIRVCIQQWCNSNKKN